MGKESIRGALHGKEAFDFVHASIASLQAKSTKEMRRRLNSIVNSLGSNHTHATHFLTSLLKEIRSHAGSPSELKEVLAKHLQLVYNSYMEAYTKLAKVAQLKLKGKEVLVYGNGTRLLFLLSSFDKKGPSALHLVDAFPLLASKSLVPITKTALCPVTYHSFAQLESALSQCDVVLLSAEFVTKSHDAVMPVGSNVILTLAHLHGIPIYVCIHPADVHKGAKTSRVLLHGNHLASRFASLAKNRLSLDSTDREVMHLSEVTGIISEQGIYPYALWKKKAL